MNGLTLRQKLALAAFLAKHIEQDIRKKQLNPEAAEEMTVGERLAAKFGGQVAAWVSMPQPATKVTSQDALLAWCRKHLPDAIEQVERVRPETARALIEDVKKYGGWPQDGDTDRIIPVDGIDTADPSPRVDLEDCAAEAIGGAWRAGDIDLGGLLALPAAHGGDIP